MCVSVGVSMCLCGSTVCQYGCMYLSVCLHICACVGNPINANSGVAFHNFFLSTSCVYMCVSVCVCVLGRQSGVWRTGGGQEGIGEQQLSWMSLAKVSPPWLRVLHFKGKSLGLTRSPSNFLLTFLLGPYFCPHDIP